MVRKIIYIGLFFLVLLNWCGCNLTVFPQYLVNIEKTASFSKYISDNCDYVHLYTLNNAVFLVFEDENFDGQRLYIVDQDFVIVNQKGAYPGSFDTFYMYDLQGSYHIGNLVFDGNFNGPSDTDLYSKITDTSAMTPPHGFGLTLGGSYQGVFWTNYYDSPDNFTAFGFSIFDAAWSSGPEFFHAYNSLDNWAFKPLGSDFRILYGSKEDVLYIANFDNKDYSSKVNIFAVYNYLANNVPQMWLNSEFDIYSNLTAQYEIWDTWNFYMTQDGVIFPTDENELGLFDYRGNKKAFYQFEWKNEDINYVIDDKGEKLYVFDKATRILSKQSIEWKFQ